jgi:hypothetical protein
VLIEEKLDDISARLETSPRKSLNRLAQETSVSKTSARKATKLLKQQSYKITVVNALKEHNRVAGIKICSTKRHEGAWVERRYSFYSFSNSALDWDE